MPRRGRPSRTDYLSTTQAAALAAEAGYPVSAKTVGRMLDRGLLHGHRTPGGVRRILRRSLEEYLRQALDNADSV